MGVSEQSGPGKVISIKRAYAELLLCVAFWGASFASMKIATRELDSFLAVWLRIFFGVLVLTPAVFIRGEFRLPRRDEVLPLLILGCIGVVFHQNIQFIAMMTAGVANANWLIAGTPSIVAVLGWVFLKEKLNGFAVSGLVVSGLGVLLVVGLGTKGMEMFRFGGWGDALMAISAVNWAAFQIVSRVLASRKPPTFIAFWINITAVLVQSAIVLTMRPDLTQLAHLSRAGWSAVLFLGCICSGFCYIMWYDGLSVLPAARVTAFQFLQPVLGAILAYFLMGERFTPYIFAGGALIILGVWMVNRRRA